MRSTETNNLYAIQSNPPNVLLTGNDQSSMFHGTHHRPKRPASRRPTRSAWKAHGFQCDCRTSSSYLWNRGAGSRAPDGEGFSITDGFTADCWGTSDDGAESFTSRQPRHPRPAACKNAPAICESLHGRATPATLGISRRSAKMSRWRRGPHTAERGGRCAHRLQHLGSRAPWFASGFAIFVSVCVFSREYSHVAIRHSGRSRRI
jgi:hypothetical protein